MRRKEVIDAVDPAAVVKQCTRNRTAMYSRLLYNPWAAICKGKNYNWLGCSSCMIKTTTRGKELVTSHLRSPNRYKTQLRKKINNIGARHPQISHMDSNTEQFNHHSPQTQQEC